MESLDREDSQELMEGLVLQENLVLKEKRVVQVLQDFLELKENQDQRVK